MVRRANKRFLNFDDRDETTGEGIICARLLKCLLIVLLIFIGLTINLGYNSQPFDSTAEKENKNWA